MILPPVCLILAGGQGTRLNALAWKRAKPAVPFGGIYRLIDFTLSNSSNSGIQRVGVLTQYLPLSLMDHIGDGSSWDMSGRLREIKVLPPQEGAKAKDWYLGTAHAVYKNLDFIRSGPEENVLILSGDHIYYMNYRKMMNFHESNNADLTIATLTVPLRDAHRFGIAVTDPDHRIIDFREKPEKPRSRLGSMGIYIIKRNVLIERLTRLIKENKMDIGSHLIPSLIHSHRVFAFPFQGYWRDVGTLDSYWRSNMDFLEQEQAANLLSWNIRTNLSASALLDRAPAQFGPDAVVEKSFVSQGCVVNGTVRRSLLGPGVRVRAGAVVSDSILFRDNSVGRDTRVSRIICDKNVHISEEVQIGLSTDQTHNKQFPGHLNTGLTLIGENNHIPPGSEIGCNCLIYPDTLSKSSEPGRLASGETYFE